MPILLVRHAEAEDRHNLGDWARGLTNEGRARFRAHAHDWRGKAGVSRIATSPLVRAVQTAEILAEAWGIREVVIREELAPAMESSGLVAELAAQLGNGWALVGHHPTLAEAAAALMGTLEPNLRLGNGAIVSLRRQDGRFALEYLAAPGTPPGR